jgi:hypothetical protein
MDSQAPVQKTMDLQTSMKTGPSDGTDAPEQEVFGSPYNDSVDSLAIMMSKWPPPPPKAVKPYLTSFKKFIDLPIEMRQMIWRHTLEPRTIEIHFRIGGGFYSKNKTPVALKVCRDSRKAVRIIPIVL